MRVLWKITKWLLLALLAAVALFLMTYGRDTYRAIYPSDAHDTVAPSVPWQFPHPAILVFSKTNGFRHGEAITAASAMFAELARINGWSVFATENGAVHSPDILSRFRVVVWSNASGNVLSDDQRAALRQFIEHGGSFIAIHAAGDNSHNRWPWYQDGLIGARFTGHTLWPHAPRATVRMEPTPHPATAGLPAIWNRTDEWYSFDRSVRQRGYHVLATVDEATYLQGSQLADKLPMGPDHPMIWTHCVGTGRALYSALGHDAATYEDPIYRTFMANTLRWAMSPVPCNGSEGGNE